MLIQQDHIIQRQIFDVQFPEREKVTDIQNRLGQLFNSRLSSLMAGIFDKEISGELLIKLDVLELELGNIAYSDLENELADRFVAELEKELASLLLRIKNDPSGTVPGLQVSTRKTGFITLLEHFLTRGFMPWWASSASATDPEKMLNELLLQNPDAVKQLVMKAGKHANARRRLVYQFSEPVLRAIITLLEPQEAAFIFEYYRDIIYTQRQKPIINTETASFEKEVMVFILSAILVDRSSTFEKKMFVKSTMEQMAAHYNLAYEHLLFLFSSATRHAKEQAKKTDHFPTLIGELFKEHVQSKHLDSTRKESPIIEKMTITQTHVDLLRHYLLFGSLPAWARLYEKTELRDLFSELIAAAPQLALELMRLAAHRETAKAQLFHLMDEALFVQLITFSEKEEVGFILNYAEVLTQFQLKINSSTEKSVIRQAVMESIFTFLFSARSPVFDKRAFLENTIKQIAGRYDRPFQAMLPVLAQFIGEGFKPNSPSAPLFYLVTGILKETEKPAEISSAPVNSISKASVIQKEALLFSTASHGVLLKDALLHFLIQGYFPWWLRDHFSGSPEKMLQELLELAPEHGQLILKLAATQYHAQQRLLTGFSPEILLLIVKTLKDGSAAHTTFQTLLVFIQTSTVLSVLNAETRNYILLLALLDTYAAGNYQQFSAALFIEKALFHVSLKTNVPFETLVRSFAPQQNERLPRSITPAIDPLPANDAPQLIDVLKESILQHKEVNKALLLSTSLEILTHFLTRNKLPEQFNELQGIALEVFLKQLLVLLSDENPNALKSLLLLPHLSLAAKIKLYQAAGSERNVAEKNSKTLLSAFVERDILQYLKEQSLVHTGSPAELRDLLLLTLDQQDGGSKKEMLRILLAMSDISYSATWQFPDDTFYKILTALNNSVTAETLNLLRHLLDFIRSTITDTLEREKICVLLKEFSLHYFAWQSGNLNISEFLSAFFNFFAARRQADGLVSFSSLLEASSKLSASSPLLISGYLPLIQKQLRQLIRFESQTRDSILDLKTADQALAGILTGIDPSEQQTSDLVQLQQHLEKQRPLKQAEDSREKLYIQNAGLVLLHPFIGTLFKRCSLTENNQFITPEARHRAAHLLQYLVAGPGTYAEHDMVLNKLLCGFPLQQPILPDILLTAEETGMALELLQEVTKQWDKLKNTSIAGLQASFLQRNAMLMQNEESWQMQVEQRGYDVLLQTLPWSFGMIKTPWMDKLLYVEWT